MESNPAKRSRWMKLERRPRSFIARAHRSSSQAHHYLAQATDCIQVSFEGMTHRRAASRSRACARRKGCSHSTLEPGHGVQTDHAHNQLFITVMRIRCGEYKLKSRGFGRKSEVSVVIRGVAVQEKKSACLYCLLQRGQMCTRTSHYHAWRSSPEPLITGNNHALRFH